MANLRATSLSSLCAALFLSACATSDIVSPAKLEEAKKASGPVFTKSEQYLRAFNAPRRAVRTTQTGIRPGYTFIGIAETDETRPLKWQIVDPGNNVVASGETTPFGYHDGSGADIQIVETDALVTPATGLVLRVEGSGESRPFDVSEDVFSSLKYDTLRYFYHNRAGMPITAEHAGGEKWARKAGHTTEVLTCFKGEDNFGITWPGCDYEVDVHGGWYDAGDHGKYVPGAGISVWTLLNAYERGTDGFSDGVANLPESGNGQNDLLDEARYELDFIMRMQAPEGTSLPVLLGKHSAPWNDDAPETVDVSGMVHHKAGDTRWAPFPLMPHSNLTPRALFPPSTASTLHLAAVGAQCARVFRGVDDAYADKCLLAAERAYQAAQRVPNAHTYNNFPGTGPYASTDPRQEFYWAAAELYVTTGEAQYADDLKAYQKKLSSAHVRGTQEISWSNTAGLGELSLARLSPDEALAEEALAGLSGTAKAYMSQMTAEGYQIPINRGVWPWGSVGTLANRAMLLGTVYDLTGDTTYRDGALDMLDYILGRNPRDVSYISGYGENAVKALHHRHWAGAQHSGYPLPPAGAVSGGPNNTDPTGPVSSAIIDQCHAQTCFADHEDAYELNSPAINIQAATFWLAAWADDIDRAE